MSTINFREPGEFGDGATMTDTPNERVSDELLVRPIMGIENRSAQEVFDIMCDRIRHDVRSSLSAVPETHPDDLAVDRFAVAMKAKLAKKRDEGRGGWDDKTDCTAEFLSQLLRDHVAKGDPLDVGNLAMMLHQRGETISPQPAAVSPADGWVMVPKSALDWLNGSGPDENGHWFGEALDDALARGGLWWRTKFSDMLAAAPQPPQPVQAGLALEDIAAWAEREASEWKRQAGKTALREFAAKLRSSSAALSQPVKVDEAMVERACKAFIPAWNRGQVNELVKADVRVDMHAALTAALIKGSSHE